MEHLCCLFYFPKLFIVNEEARSLDHSAMVLLPKPMASLGQRHFRFTWLREPDCRAKVEEAWHSLSSD
ncbi:hypothetical protein M5689_019821 [Euphorbia peplus]|nr:hypothetical protein M5689_019821 [Euphorbia peplus]